MQPTKYMQKAQLRITIQERDRQNISLTKLKARRERFNNEIDADIKVREDHLKDLNASIIEQEKTLAAEG